jgi:hypothetical protein
MDQSIQSTDVGLDISKAEPVKPHVTPCERPAILSGLSGLSRIFGDVFTPPPGGHRQPCARGVQARRRGRPG